MVVVALAAFAVACGARTGVPGGDPDADPFTGVCPASGTADAPCGPLTFQLGTQESCALTTSRPADALGFVPFSCPIQHPNCAHQPPGDCFAVFALLRYGKGHVAASCDSTTLSELIPRAKLIPTLGQKVAPRIARLGTGYFGTDPIGTNLGGSLPPNYVDPAVLAADWDVLVVSGGEAAWAPTIGSFVRDFGKGLLAVLDYVSAVMPPTKVDPMNAITRPMGITFQPVDLGYATLDVDLACVPDVP